jgi:hypothetical protein
MSTVFLVCVVLGATILLAQIVLTALGLGGGSHLEGAHLEAPDAADGHGGFGELAHGLDLLSVRSLSAGVAIFGAAGLALARVVPPLLAVPLALFPGLLAAAGTAYLTRQMLRLESSGSLLLEGTVGQEGSVYLTIPAASAGSERHGLVHLNLQGRTVELRAVTSESCELPTGSPVVVISVAEGGETVEVVLPSTLEGKSP